MGRVVAPAGPCRHVGPQQSGLPRSSASGGSALSGSAGSGRTLPDLLHMRPFVGESDRTPAPGHLDHLPRVPWRLRRRDEPLEVLGPPLALTKTPSRSSHIARGAPRQPRRRRSRICLETTMKRHPDSPAPIPVHIGETQHRIGRHYPRKRMSPAAVLEHRQQRRAGPGVNAVQRHAQISAAGGGRLVLDHTRGNVCDRLPHQPPRFRHGLLRRARAAVARRGHLAHQQIGCCGAHCSPRYRGRPG